DRRRGQRPGPVLHPAAGQPLGRRPDGRPDLGPRDPAPLDRSSPRAKRDPRSAHTARSGSRPATQTVAADAAQKPGISPADFSIVNQPGAASYPISGYSWALVYVHQHNQATGQALVTMLDWLTHDGQASAANGYVPLR